MPPSTLTPVVALLAVLATWPLSASAAPSIAGEVRYKPHTLVKLKADGVDAKAGLHWRVFPGEVVQRATTPRGLLEFAAPPGKYEVELLVISAGADGGFEIQDVRTSVVIESCHHPEPPPSPNPNPPPQGGGKLDPVNALGRITFGTAGCTATVVAPRRGDGRWDVLTAAHCLGAVGQHGTLRMPASGKVYPVTVVSLDRTRDIGWLVTDDSIDEIEYALLAKKNPPVGAMVWHMGYGVDRPRNREDGSVGDLENSEGQIRFVLSVSSGDSGGGIFRTDTGEVVGTVCCTSGMAKKVSMWAGSAEQAWKLRPGAKQGAEGGEGWQPVPIPVRPDPSTGTGRLDGWEPIPIPVRPGPVDGDGWQPLPIPIRQPARVEVRR